MKHPLSNLSDAAWCDWLRDNGATSAGYSMADLEFEMLRNNGAPFGTLPDMWKWAETNLSLGWNSLPTQQSEVIAKTLVGTNKYLVRTGGLTGGPRFGRYTFWSGWFRATSTPLNNAVFYGASDGGTAAAQNTLANARYSSLSPGLKQRLAVSAYTWNDPGEVLGYDGINYVLNAGAEVPVTTDFSDWTHICLYTDNGNDWNDIVGLTNNNDEWETIVYRNGVGFSEGGPLASAGLTDSKPYINFRSGDSPDSAYAAVVAIGTDATSSAPTPPYFTRVFTNPLQGGEFADVLMHSWAEPDFPTFDPDATALALYNGGSPPVLGNGTGYFWTQPLVLFTDEVGYGLSDNQGTGGAFDYIQT